MFHETSYPYVGHTNTHTPWMSNTLKASSITSTLPLPHPLKMLLIISFWLASTNFWSERIEAFTCVFNMWTYMWQWIQGIYFMDFYFFFRLCAPPKLKCWEIRESALNNQADRSRCRQPGVPSLSAASGGWSLKSTFHFYFHSSHSVTCMFWLVWYHTVCDVIRTGHFTNFSQSQNVMTLIQCL